MKNILLAICLMFGATASMADTKFVESQCFMLADMHGEFAARIKRGETPEKFLPELFPKLNSFPADVQELVKLMPKVVAKDEAVQQFPPDEHKQDMLNFCFGNAGDVSSMIEGLKKYLAST